jgi:hypothetical protein
MLYICICTVFVLSSQFSPSKCQINLSRFPYFIQSVLAAICLPSPPPVHRTAQPPKSNEPKGRNRPSARKSPTDPKILFAVSIRLQDLGKLNYTEEAYYRFRTYRAIVHTKPGEVFSSWLGVSSLDVAFAKRSLD